MSKPTLPRLGAATGALFAIVLFVANGDGSSPFTGARAVAGTVALALSIPFVAYLYGLLREAEGGNGWLSATALGAGIAAMTLKLGSGAGELAIQRAHAAAGSQLYAALDGIGGGATILSLYPLAIFCAATATVVLRTRVLPVWLGVFAAVTAAALVVNAGFLGADSVPAFLLFIVWTAVASGYLVVRASRRPAAVAPASVGAPA